MANCPSFAETTLLKVGTIHWRLRFKRHHSQAEVIKRALYGRIVCQVATLHTADFPTASEALSLDPQTIERESSMSDEKPVASSAKQNL